MGCGSSFERGKKKKTSSILTEAKGEPDSSLCLLWVCTYSSFYRTLDSSLRQKLSRYIGTPPVLLAWLDSQAYLFSPSTAALRPYFSLSNLEHDLQQCTFMGYGKVFMSVYTGNIYEPLQFQVYREGQALLVGEYDNKFDCELIYDSAQDCVYTFGGQTIGYNCSATAATEVFTASTLKFRQTTDMQRPRSHFGCCWHLGLVYLCGGGYSVIETFDPSTETFSDHSVTERWMEHVQFSASYRGDLILLLTQRHSYRLQGSDWVVMERPDRKRNFRSGTAIAWGGVVFYQHASDASGMVVGTDLADGNEETYELGSNSIERYVA